jgi:hypothetical protein
MVEIFQKQSWYRNLFCPTEPKYSDKESGVQGVVWQVLDSEDTTVDVAALGSHMEHIKELEQMGGHPLSFREIQNHLGDTFDRWVLFDGILGSVLPDNHWRVQDLDTENKKVTLKFCGTFGNYDMTGVKPFTLPVDTPFFTGLSVQTNIHDTQGPLSLDQVVDIFKARSEPSHISEIPIKNSKTIYWVDEIMIDPKLINNYKFIPHSN